MLLAGEKQAPCPAGGPGFVLQCSPRLRLCFASRGVQRFPWVHAPPPVLHWCGPALSPPGGGGPTFAVLGSIFPTTHASHRGDVKHTFGHISASLHVGSRGPGRRHAAPDPGPRQGSGKPTCPPQWSRGSPTSRLGPVPLLRRTLWAPGPSSDQRRGRCS